MKALTLILALLLAVPAFAQDAPIYYQFDADGFMTGQREAQPSPEEPGVFFGPAKNETDVAPPVDKPGFIRRFNGVSWSYVENHTGETIYYTSDGLPYVLDPAASKDIYPHYGPIPKGFTATPKPGEFYEWDEAQGTWVENTAKKDAVADQIGRTTELLADPDRKSLDDALRVATPQQIETYVTNKMANCTSIASCRTIIGRALIEILTHLAAERQVAE